MNALSMRPFSWSLQPLVVAEASSLTETFGPGRDHASGAETVPVTSAPTPSVAAGAQPAADTVAPDTSQPPPDTPQPVAAQPPPSTAAPAGGAPPAGTTPAAPPAAGSATGTASLGQELGNAFKTIGRSAGKWAIAGATVGLLSSAALFATEAVLGVPAAIAIWPIVQNVVIPAAGGIYGWMNYGPKWEGKLGKPASRILGAAVGAAAMKYLAVPGGVGTDFLFFGVYGGVYGALTGVALSLLEYKPK